MSLPTTDPVAARDRALPATRGIGLARWFLRRALLRISVGRLTVVTPTGEHLHAGSGDPTIQAVLILRTWRVLPRLLLRTDVGLAEAYRDGEIDTPDLAALIELLARNQATLGRLYAGAWPARLFNRIRHLRNANTPTGSRRNIMAHYDLGNEFYERWLDAGMTYSSALYETGEETLEAAQERKLDRIVAMLGLEGGEHVLEIGCGWGTLAVRLAREGCRVTAITISPAQLAVAKRQVAEAGFADRVSVELCDYRDVAGRFDRIVSIEMIEAVGHSYWPVYFASLGKLLASGGRAVLQSITIDERSFESYRQGSDFIQRYIFPGGCLPSLQVIECEARKVGLQPEERLDFGADYALTLGEWRRRFVQSWPGIAQLGFDGGFRRLWEFYLCYCEAGFRTGKIDVRLLTLIPSEELRVATSYELGRVVYPS